MQLPGHAKVEHFIKTKWTTADHQTLEAEAGNPKHQAEWEAYMLLGAARTWHKMLAAHTGKWRMIGYAKGVLQGVIARKAKSPRINYGIFKILARIFAIDLDPHRLVDVREHSGLRIPTIEFKPISGQLRGQCPRRSIYPNQRIIRIQFVGVKGLCVLARQQRSRS